MLDPEKVPAILRTVIPSLWGTIITWVLVNVISVPADVEAWLRGPLVLSFVTSLVIGLWYAFWRWLEPRLSPFWTRFLLGSNRTPSYGEFVDEDLELEGSESDDQLVTDPTLSGE